ncbi:MAG TPA: DUF4190 domain-containing protein [Streptosporangiaceae bacterium]
MADMSWEHAAEARAALNAIVTDPEHGVAALSSPRTMSNLLKDLLPDAPREKNLLIAAAEAGLADTLNEHVALGMDANTAIRLTASSFSQRTPLTPDACSWVTGEIAVAMGISERNDQDLGTSSQDHGGAGLAGSSDQQGRSWDQPGPSPVRDGFPSSEGDRSRVSDNAPPAAAGLGAGSAVVSPGQTAASSYRSAPGAQPPGGQAGYQQATPGYQQAAPGHREATPGYQAGSGYSSATPGYVPPTAFSPAQNPQAYGPGVAAGMPAMPGYQPVPQPGISRRTNTMAVTSLVLGMVQFVGWIIFLLPGLLAAILAIVLGFVSIKQISRSGEAGRGIAITGIVLGFLAIVVSRSWWRSGSPL